MISLHEWSSNKNFIFSFQAKKKIFVFVFNFFLNFFFISGKADSSADEMSDASSQYGSMNGGQRSMFQSRPSSTPLIRDNGRENHNHNGRQTEDDGYEELFKDSIPCPSCKGLGRVPRGKTPCLSLSHRKFI